MGWIQDDLRRREARPRKERMEFDHGGAWRRGDWREEVRSS
jgi:hypothetical protein